MFRIGAGASRTRNLRLRTPEDSWPSSICRDPHPHPTPEEAWAERARAFPELRPSGSRRGAHGLGSRGLRPYKERARAPGQAGLGGPRPEAARVRAGAPPLPAVLRFLPSSRSAPPPILPCSFFFSPPPPSQPSPLLPLMCPGLRAPRTSVPCGFETGLTLYPWLPD